MIEHGADIKSQLRFGASKTDLAMAQLLQYNCYARYRKGVAPQRHSKDRETSFPIREYGSTLYVGLARAVSPTNTNFRLTFLLTRIQEALYEDLAV